MISILECLNINLIKELREKHLSLGLDKNDSVSYHLVGKCEDDFFGTARFYKKGNDIVIDSIAFDVEKPIALKEMLVRSLIARAIDVGCDKVVVYDSLHDLYTELGFSSFSKDCYEASSDKIVFNCKCNNRRNGNEE